MNRLSSRSGDDHAGYSAPLANRSRRIAQSVYAWYPVSW
jgi:hypothetical protein